LATLDRIENRRWLIPAVADGLLLYKLHLGKWVAHTMERLFTPALSIL